MYDIGLENLSMNLDKIFCLTKAERDDIDISKFGVPRLRKFPLDTEKRVKSAIAYFRYAKDEDKGLLARKILTAAKKYDIEVKSTLILKWANKSVTSASLESFWFKKNEISEEDREANIISIAAFECAKILSGPPFPVHYDRVLMNVKHDGKTTSVSSIHVVEHGKKSPVTIKPQDMNDLLKVLNQLWKDMKRKWVSAHYDISYEITGGFDFKYKD